MADLSNILKSEQPISATLVEQAMASTFLGDMAAARHALVYCHDRIARRIEKNTAGRFLVRYYLECVILDPVATDMQHSRFEAARELQRLLEHWMIRPTEKVLAMYLVDEVTRVYKEGDSLLRNALETGFLEHVFERPELITLFEHWRTDTETSESFHCAAAWGAKHTRTNDM